MDTENRPTSYSIRLVGTHGDGRCWVSERRLSGTRNSSHRLRMWGSAGGLSSVSRRVCCRQERRRGINLTQGLMEPGTATHTHRCEARKARRKDEVRGARGLEGSGDTTKTSPLPKLTLKGQCCPDPNGTSAQRSPHLHGNERVSSRGQDPGREGSNGADGLRVRGPTPQLLP